MKVGIELFKGKTLKDGTNPIAIRLTHNGRTKYKMCGISIKPQHWNNDKKRITCRENNFRIKNELIKQQYNQIEERANFFEKNNIEFDFDFIFSNKGLTSYNNVNPMQNFNSNNFIDIVRARTESYPKIKTKENYKAFLSAMLKLYGEYIDVNQINQYFAVNFKERLDNANYSNNHKNTLIKCFKSSYRFGVENRWITRPYAFELKSYPHKPLDRDISIADTTKIINLFKKQIAANFEMIKYEPLAIFCLDIAFQGLSPYDLARIKINDLIFYKVKNIDPNYELINNDNRYRNYINNNLTEREVIKINTYRSKTNTYVPICCDYETIRPILYFLCKGKKHDDYLVNCFSSKKEYNEKQLHNRCGNYFMQLSSRLNPFLHEINVTKKITFYFARHAFINALDTMDIPHDLIRKMVGHKSSTIERSYINKATDWEQSDIIFRIFNNKESIANLEVNSKGEYLCNNQWNKLELFLKKEIDLF